VYVASTYLDSSDLELSDPLPVVDLVLTLILTLLLFVRVVLRPVWTEYLFSWYGMLDLLTIIPGYLVFSSASSRVLSLARLLRIMRVSRARVVAAAAAAATAAGARQ
jgi:voltage-gated potassium channel